MSELAPSRPFMKPAAMQPGHPEYSAVHPEDTFAVPPAVGSRTRSGEIFNPPLPSETDDLPHAQVRHRSSPERNQSPQLIMGPQLPPLSETIKKPFRAAKDAFLKAHGAAWDIPTYGLANATKKGTRTLGSKIAQPINVYRQNHQGGSVVTPLKKEPMTLEEEDKLEARWDARIRESNLVARRERERLEEAGIIKPIGGRSTVTAVEENPSSNPESFSEVKESTSNVQVPEFIRKTDPETAKIWDKLPVHERVTLFRIATEMSLLANANPEGYQRDSEYIDKLRGYEIYSDVAKTLYESGYTKDSQERTWKNVAEEDILRQENWDKLPSDVQDALVFSQQEVDKVKRENPQSYLNSEAYVEAYDRLIMGYAVAAQIFFPEEHKFTGELSEKQQIVLEIHAVGKQMQAILDANPEAAATDPVYQHLYIQYQRLLDNNLHLFAAPEEQPEVVDNEQMADAVEPEGFPVEPEWEDSGEKRKLSKGTKVALGGLGIAAAGVAVYYGYKHMPDEAKDKIKGTAVDNAKKVKAAASTGGTKVATAAKKAREAAPTKAQVVEAARKVRKTEATEESTIKPNVEVALKGAKRTAGKMYQRVRSSEGAAKVAGRVRAGASAVKNRKK